MTDQETYTKTGLSQIMKQGQKRTAPSAVKRHRYARLYQRWWRMVNVEDGILSIAICGKRGSGKSWIMMYLGWLLDRDAYGRPRFNSDKISFKASEFLEWLNKPKKEWERGSVIALDDAGLHMYNRDSLTSFIKAINKTLQNIRYKHPIVILTLPSFKMLDKHARDMTDVYIEAVRRNKKTRENLCKVHELYIESYEGALLRYNIEGTRFGVHPRLNLPIRYREPIYYRVGAPPAWLVKEYEVKKKNYLDAYNLHNIDFLRNEEEAAMDLRKDKRQRMNFPDAVNYCTKKIDEIRDIKGTVSSAKIMLLVDERGNQLFGISQARLISTALKGMAKGVNA